MSVLKVATAVCCILVSLLNVPFISSLAIAPQIVLCLVCAGAVVSPAIGQGVHPSLGAPVSVSAIMDSPSEPPASFDYVMADASPVLIVFLFALLLAQIL